MKLIDGLKLKGKPAEIPDCSRDDLPEFFKQLGFKVGAEIEVAFGNNLEKYCQAGLEMYGIDPWATYNDYPYPAMDQLYYMALKKLSPYPNCTLIRKMSENAVKDFRDHSLDFIYIDGNHGYDYVAKDLVKWSQIVKKGGIIAGHDYYILTDTKRNRMVKPAVDAFIKSHQIKNWYILGRAKPNPGEINDQFLSFMFFKNW